MSIDCFMTTPIRGVYLETPLWTPKPLTCFNSVKHDIDLMFDLENNFRHLDLDFKHCRLTNDTQTRIFQEFAFQ